MEALGALLTAGLLTLVAAGALMHESGAFPRTFALCFDAYAATCGLGMLAAVRNLWSYRYARLPR